MGNKNLRSCTSFSVHNIIEVVAVKITNEWLAILLDIQRERQRGEGKLVNKVDFDGGPVDNLDDGRGAERTCDEQAHRLS